MITFKVICELPDYDHAFPNVGDATYYAGGIVRRGTVLWAKVYHVNSDGSLGSLYCDFSGESA